MTELTRNVLGSIRRCVKTALGCMQRYMCISIVSISKAGLKAAALDAGHETFSLPYVFC